MDINKNLIPVEKYVMGKALSTEYAIEQIKEGKLKGIFIDSKWHIDLTQQPVFTNDSYTPKSIFSTHIKAIVVSTSVLILLFYAAILIYILGSHMNLSQAMEILDDLCSLPLLLFIPVTLIALRQIIILLEKVSDKNNGNP